MKEAISLHLETINEREKKFVPESVFVKAKKVAVNA